MSRLNGVQSSTNNQSTERSSSKAPFLLAHDNFKNQANAVKQFLYNGTRYTLEELTAIFALTNSRG